jgi:predicted lipoprotein with Yx(FWY)xxD motif
MNGDERMNRKISTFKTFNLVAILAVAAIILAACAPAATPTPAAAVPNPPAALPAAATATTAPAAPAATSAPAMVTEPTIAVANNPTFGNILVDGKGMTLYLFTMDTPGVSNCDAKCLAYWPPLLTNGSPVAGTGVDASLFGTATLPDGSKIVTYNKMPLYYFIKDKNPGDTTGENVTKNWFVVDPTGKPIMPAAPAATPTVAAAMAEVSLNVAQDAKLGSILVDGKGMTLYQFKKDTAGVSNCSGGCLTNWPPLVTQGHPTLGMGIDASKIGTAKLADGSLVVTYNGLPLYFFAKDSKAGDTTGQGVGGLWNVVAP